MDVHAALASAASGPVAEGTVGAGTGTSVFKWKGGIGTSSRVLPRTLGGWTVGVLPVLGALVGRELGTFAFKDAVSRERGDGTKYNVGRR